MTGVYEIYVKDHFAASHALKGYGGICSKIHGHNWTVEAWIQCTRLNKLGIGINFKDVKHVIRDVLDKLDHTTLNEIMEFGSINPTAENLAKFVYGELSRRLNTEHIKVNKIMVFESPECGAAYQER
ncbi:MAG: 6-carboxytetrahydropterin synthase QueD [Desulfobacter sp.]|nr:MAG: 6-carboxytetrahydropterin synthase QueD [Desulfobacter sp.]